MQIDVRNGAVADAWVTSPLYRGYEQMLQGKNPFDALVYVPRICGICSVAQSVASGEALAAAMGVTPTPNGQRARNLILAVENVADHLTHFSLFFMPDFARDAYRDAPWFDAAVKRFKAVSGESARHALPARAQLLNLLGILAGKWPHSLAIQPGGSTRPIEPREQGRMAALLHDFRHYLETRLFGDSLETIANLDSVAALQHWAAQEPFEQSDFRFFLHLCQALELDQLGRAQDQFLSYGAYSDEESHLFAPGVMRDGAISPLESAQISEDHSHSWMAAAQTRQHPYEGVTRPAEDRQRGYSWCKAPRLAQAPMEVGALARQAMAQQPLMTELIAHSGGNVQNRVIARLLEVARVTLAMEQWVWALQPRAPYCAQAPAIEQGRGAGLIEAARGALGHWITVESGRIANYQIIAPTTWNFSPRDAGGGLGPLEQALIGAPVASGEAEPVTVQHIVRSFDPCMVCTVH
ncbi:putative nickel-dependent hydrogenase, large subunit [Magnetofaba australis IT-1]|uniref:Putative nickel-dependent hydrogenase, large subunit n=1 Tax=Magnetofaba australis IT-1 TaxID=1434232 RepID=A0A1Y2KBK9_9PROT|nr:putative nickel-dependent hydrogenase, large subunit [Magnetofaba australis IT-1]